MAAHVVDLVDQNASPTDILLEDWAFGTKPTVATTAARFGPFTQGAIKIKNLGNQTIFVRADDGTAADNGQSDPLRAGDAGTYAIVSADNKISLMAAAAITTGAVYVMPIKGTR